MPPSNSRRTIPVVENLSSAPAIVTAQGRKFPIEVVTPGRTGQRVAVVRILKLSAIAVVLCVAAGAVLIGVSNWSRGAQPPVTDSAPPTAVAALGRVEPQSEVINLGAGTSPERLDSLLVGRGDPVQAGQVLGYLSGYAEQIAEREMYRAQLEEATRKLATQTELDQVRIDEAEIKQKQVLEIEPLRIAAQEGAVASLEATLANEKEILAAQLELSGKGATTVRERDNQQTQVIKTEADLNSSRSRLDELKRQFEIDKLDAETQAKEARASLARDTAGAPIASLTRQIELADARARTLTLLAPATGRVLNILVKPGEQVGTGPIITMGDTSRMRVVAEVYETDIARVQLGQRAIVSSRALQRPVGGKVVRIGDMIFKNDVLNVDPAARADARVVEVWIELDDAHTTENLTNLTVDVLINPSERELSRLNAVAAR
jgi:HlyD family secretion protein